MVINTPHIDESPQDYHLFKIMAEKCQDGICISRNGIVIYANPRLCEILEKPLDFLVGRPYITVVLPEERVYLLTTAGDPTSSTQTPEKLEYWTTASDGTRHFLMNRYCSYLAADGAKYQYVFTTDLSNQKQYEEKLQFSATHDPLTNLPNRSLFFGFLDRALARGYRYGKIVAVVLLDLDNFKQINDTRGHFTGDQVLRAVAERLLGCLRLSDSVARLGGDEFTVIIEDLTSENDINVVASKLLHAFDLPFPVDGELFAVNASIGISVFPVDGDNVQTLLQKADIAMYRAKLHGSNFQLYSMSQVSEQASKE